jgi:hypothetical protein
MYLFLLLLVIVVANKLIAGYEPYNLIVVLDKSASMASRQYETLQSYNMFLRYQYNICPLCRISLVLFSSWESISLVYHKKLAWQLSPLSTDVYSVGGNTALYDAMGYALHELDGEHESTVYIVITDGEENDSMRYSRERIYEKIGDMKLNIKKQGLVLFIGSNQDAIAVSSQFGISSSHSLLFHDDFLADVLYLITHALSRASRNNDLNSFAFTDIERNAAIKGVGKVPHNIPNPKWNPEGCGLGIGFSKFLCDPDHLVSQEAKTTIVGLMGALEHSVQVAVLIIDQISPNQIEKFNGDIDRAAEDFVTNVFVNWPIGGGLYNNQLTAHFHGNVVFMFISLHERKLMLSTGEKLHSRFTSDNKNAVYAEMGPYMRNKDYGTAIVRGLEEISKYIVIRVNNDCPIGKYASASISDQCLDCEIGTYTNMRGSLFCEVCPAGQSSSYPFDKCIDCQPGYYNSFNGSACRKCAPGSVANNPGSISCTLCPIGTFSYHVVANRQSVSYCADCPAGSYANATGTGTCTVCEEGKYTIKLGSTNCESCPVGTTSQVGSSISAIREELSVQGAVLPLKDQDDDFVKSQINMVCFNCPIGYYNNESGQTCKICPYGKYSDETGSIDCKNCRIGQTSREGVCLDCPVGYFSEKVASEDCTECPANTISEPGSAGCHFCDAGQVLVDKWGFFRHCQVRICTIDLFGSNDSVDSNLAATELFQRHVQQ